MAVEKWIDKGYTHTFNTNSRAYELLLESKKNPEKINDLRKHLKQLSENEKTLIKNAEKVMTPEALERCEQMHTNFKEQLREKVTQ